MIYLGSLWVPCSSWSSKVAHFYDAGFEQYKKIPNLRLIIKAFNTSEIPKYS